MQKLRLSRKGGVSAVARNLVTFLTNYALDKIRENIRISQKVITNEVPWSSGQRKSSYEHRTRIGNVVAKYPNFFIVQFPKYKECFRYTDVAANVVQLCDETEEDQNTLTE